MSFVISLHVACTVRNKIGATSPIIFFIRSRVSQQDAQHNTNKQTQRSSRFSNTTQATTQNNQTIYTMARKVTKEESDAEAKAKAAHNQDDTEANAGVSLREVQNRNDDRNINRNINNTPLRRNPQRPSRNITPGMYASASLRTPSSRTATDRSVTAPVISTTTSSTYSTALPVANTADLQHVNNSSSTLAVGEPHQGTHIAVSLAVDTTQANAGVSLRESDSSNSNHSSTNTPGVTPLRRNPERPGRMNTPGMYAPPSRTFQSLESTNNNVTAPVITTSNSNSTTLPVANTAHLQHVNNNDSSTLAVVNPSQQIVSTNDGLLQGTNNALSSLAEPQPGPTEYAALVNRLTHQHTAIAASGQPDLGNRLAQLLQQYAQLGKQIATLQQETRDRVDSIDGRVEALESDFRTIGGHVEGVQGDVRDLVDQTDHRFHSVHRNQAELLFVIAALSDRITALEAASRASHTEDDVDEYFDSLSSVRCTIQ